MVRQAWPKRPLLGAMLYIAKVWLAFFVVLTPVVVTIRLWGTGVPVGRYPEIVVRVLFSIPMFLVFLLIMGVYFIELWRLRRKNKADNRAESSDVDT